VGEELGGEVRSMELFGVYSNFFEGKNDHIVIFLTNNFSIGKTGFKEIEEVKTFPINDLPNNISPGSQRRIDEFLRKDGRVFFGKW